MPWTWLVTTIRHRRVATQQEIVTSNMSEEFVAEGIETEAQLRTVIGLGVDLLQGYYLSRPAAVPAPIAPAAQAVIDQLEHQRFDPLGL